MKISALLLLTAATLFTGCQTIPPKDYTAFRQSNPRTILILPPVNETTEVLASYSLLTTTTRPVAELGYYVVPIVMVDHFMKENGMTLPAQMQEAPLPKLQEVFGADAVLYIAIEKYGSKYQIFASNTVVAARAKLVDAHTGAQIWEGRTETVLQGQSGLLEAVVGQIVNKLFDQAHGVAALASVQLLVTPNQGLLKGPHHPDFGKPN